MMDADDEEVEAEDEEEPQVMHKPAGAMQQDVVLKRPSGKAQPNTGVCLREEDAQQKAAEVDQENKALNGALQACINMLRQRGLTMREWSARLTNMEVAENTREASMKDIYNIDVEKAFDDFLCKYDRECTPQLHNTQSASMDGT